MFNQLTETCSVADLGPSGRRGVPNGATVEHPRNPRVEADGHYYRATSTALPELGLQPHLLDESLLTDLLNTARTQTAR